MMSITARGGGHLTQGLHALRRSSPSFPVVRKATSTSAVRRPSYQPAHVKLNKRAATEIAATKAARPPGRGVLGDDLVPEDYISIEGVQFDRAINSWTARWVTQERSKHKWGFAVKKYGFFEAKKLAERARAEALAAGARSHETRAEGKPPDAKHQSDQPGVNWDDLDQRWIAKWVDADTGKWVRKSFSAATYGLERAKELANAARKEAEQQGKARTKGQRSMALPTAKHQSHVPGVTYDGTPGSERWVTMRHQRVQR